MRDCTWFACLACFDGRKEGTEFRHTVHSQERFVVACAETVSAMASTDPSSLLRARPLRIKSLRAASIFSFGCLSNLFHSGQGLVLPISTRNSNIFSIVWAISASL